MLPPSEPEPPVVTEVRSTSCTVTYQPPRRDNGAPVTGYILERRTAGPDSEWIRVNDTPVTELRYTIDNLTIDTEYEFRVAAVNKEGEGDFSLVSARIMTLVRPDKPGRPEVMEVTGTSVRLQWTAPHSDGRADITQYDVKCSTSDKTECIVVPADTNTEPLISYTIRNQLQPYTTYTFAVAAVNRMGQGPWSDCTEIETFAGMLNTRALSNHEVIAVKWFKSRQDKATELWPRPRRNISALRPSPSTTVCQ